MVTITGLLSPAPGPASYTPHVLRFSGRGSIGQSEASIGPSGPMRGRRKWPAVKLSPDVVGVEKL